MHGIGKWFFLTAIAYGLLGMLLGLHMGVSKDHGQMPTHAHIMVIGWVSFAIFGMFYSGFGAHVPKVLSYLHFIAAELSFAGMAASLWLVYSGETQYEPVLAITSIAYAASFVLFAITALFSSRERKPS